MRYIFYIVFFAVSSFFFICNANEQQLSQSESELIQIIAREHNPLIRQEKMVQFLVGKDELTRFVILPLLSITCIQNKDYSAAESYAKEMLSLSNIFKENWNYGNAIHDGNMVLGIKALVDKDINLAKKYLIKAGLAPESPQIHVYGPYMLLADGLLNAGEDAVVISYLESLKSSWIDNDGRIESWIASIKGGVKPYFGRNLPFRIIETETKSFEKK